MIYKNKIIYIKERIKQKANYFFTKQIIQDTLNVFSKFSVLTQENRNLLLKFVKSTNLKNTCKIMKEIICYRNRKNRIRIIKK